MTDAPAGDRSVLYPNHYVWFVFLSAMDAMVTWVVLYRGGREVNALADWVIRRYGLAGMVAYKFLLVVVVVAVCELTGRRKPATGRSLARLAVVVGCVPVALGLALLLRDVWGG